MGNYIKKPKFLDDLQLIESNNFKKINFRKYYDDKNDLYNLDLLRDIYVSDRKLFFDIRDEMLLRGFVIRTEIKSSLFPTIEIENNKKIIDSISPTDNYLNIDFNSLGLSNLLKRFNIKSDRFFNRIPLNNFQYINKEVNLDLLYESFVMNDFFINTDGEFYPVTSNDSEIIEENNTDNINNKITIKKYFADNLYNMFVDFCHKNDVIYIDEITNDLLKQFEGVKFVGKKKVETVRERLDNLDSFDNIEQFKEDSDKFEFERLKLDNLLTKSFAVKYLFFDNKFKVFRDFCEEKEIVYIEDLGVDDLDSFGKTKGVGKIKFNDIKDKLSDIQDEIKSKSHFIFSYNLNYFDIHEFTVNEVLDFLNIEGEIESDFTVEELYNQDIRDMEMSEDEKGIIFNLSNIFYQVTEPNKIIKNFLNELKTQNNGGNRDYEILIYRRIDKLTLEEIGENVDLTRERVRQIADKVEKDLISYLDNHLFKESLLLSFLTFDYYKDKIFSYEDLSHFLEKNYTFVLDILKIENEFFYYEDTYKLFFLNQDEKNLFRIEMKNITEELPDVFLLEEVNDFFQLDYFRNDLLSRVEFLEINSYSESGEIYSNKHLSIKDFVKFVFKRDLPKEVTMNDKNYKKIINLLKMKYNYELTSPKRSLIGAVRRSEEFILSGKNTYQLFDITNYDITLLEQAIEYCDQELKKRSVINIIAVFEKFKDRLNKKNIMNKTHLYSILKYLYSDRYTFGKGNTLNIYRDENKKIDEVNLLISFMKDNDGIRSKEAIKKYFNWSDQRIMFKIYSSDRLVNWGKSNFRLIDGWVTKTQIENVNQIIKVFFREQGFITENQLYEEALFSSSLNQLIKKEKIDSSSKFRNTFRFYIETLKRNSIVIIPEESAHKNMKDIILEKFPDGVTRKGLDSYLKNELKYNVNTAESIISKLLSQNKMFEMKLGYLYPTKKLNISEEVIRELLKYIEKEKNGKPYIILKKLVGYRTELPSIDIEWTPHLMKYLLLNNGYKEMEIFNNDYRMDQLILLEEDNKMQSFDELIHYSLKKNYQGNWHESYIVNFLEEEGFIYKKRATRKKMPVSLYKKSSLVKVNELGIVELVGD